MRLKITPSLVTVVLSVAALAGYLGYRAAVEHPTPASAYKKAPQRPLADSLPKFAMPNLAGKEQSIKSFAGKPLLINFWATWCAPCRREIPMLKTIQKDNPSLTVIGIAVDNREAVADYAKKMQFNYPILIGEAPAIAAASSFGVDFFALPFTVFVGAKGHVLGAHTGELHTADVDNALAVFGDLAKNRIGVEEARKRIAARM